LSLAPYLRLREDGIELAVRVTPRAGSARIGGTVRDAAGDAWLAVKVTEAAEAGRATQAAARLVARHCGVAPSAVRLISGAASRWKRLLIAGDAASLCDRLAEVAEEPA
jgi:uncharacterized protein YggU (UPF0235/DUF167 family)